MCVFKKYKFLSRAWRRKENVKNLFILKNLLYCHMCHEKVLFGRWMSCKISRTMLIAVFSLIRLYFLLTEPLVRSSRALCNLHTSHRENPIKRLWWKFNLSHSWSNFLLINRAKAIFNLRKCQLAGAKASDKCNIFHLNEHTQHLSLLVDSFTLFSIRPCPNITYTHSFQKNI